MKSCINFETGPTLKCRKTLTCSLPALIRFNLFVALEMYIFNYKALVLALVLRNNSENFHRFLWESLQGLYDCELHTILNGE